MAKRILFSIDNLVGGGAERSVISLAQTLSNKGHLVVLLTLESRQDYEIGKGFTYQTLGLSANKDAFSQLINWLDAYESKHGKFDLIISNLKKSDELFTRIDRDEIHFCIHNHTSVRELIGKSRWKKQGILNKVRRIYKNKNIIPVSQGVANDMVDTLRVNPRSVNTIYNGFNIPEIRELAQERVELPYDNYIVHVGSFKDQKRHDRLLQSYAKSGIPAPLVLLGKGSTSRSKKIKKLIQKLKINDQVYMAGFHENVYPWIAGARMLVLSSDCEGFGRVIVEALICKTPVVSTDCPSGPSEILSGNLKSCLTTLDVDSLATTMKSIYEQTPKISEAHVHQWSIEKMANRYLELIK